MRRPVKRHSLAYVSLVLAWGAAAWVGCAEPATTPTSGSSSSASTSSSSGDGGAGGTGGVNIDVDGGGTGGDGGACVTIEADAHRIPLDIVFLIDRSSSMTGPKWEGTKMGLTTFFTDAASAGIGAGLVYFPAQKPEICEPVSYSTLDVPIGTLPGNSFALTNSLPFSPLGNNTPTFPALKGALQAATAYQDTHEDHKVVVVIATDGDPTSCPPVIIDDIAKLALSARNYNGVRTYVIGVAGSTIANLDKIAEAGGTTKAYDITQDIAEFSAKMEEIRSEALGCDFGIPMTPDGSQINYNLVNFTYTPKGIGAPKIVPRADDLADCNGQSGWYYDSNLSPRKILLCPATCSTVTADDKAKVAVLFGCDFIPN